jgi:hypothetical protein
VSGFEAIDGLGVSKELLVRSILISLVLLALAASNSTRADILSVPALVGTIGTEGRQVNFDFGRQFTEIRSVSLIVSGFMTPYYYQSCGTISHPEPCILTSYGSGIIATVEDDVYGALAWGSIKGFAVLGSTQGGTLHPFSGQTLSGLLDGRARLAIEPIQLSTLDGIVHEVIPPAANVLSFSVLVDGTPVPEPGLGVQLAFGSMLLGLASKRRTGCGS